VKDDKVYLQHILDAILSIEEYTAGGREEFLQRKMVRDAVIRNLEVIGEAVKNLSEDVRANCPAVPWQKVAGLRDVLIHQYFGVNPELVWQITESRLPELKQRVTELLNAPS